MTVTDFDDFIVWVTLRRHPRRAPRYVLFYNPATSRGIRSKALQLWKGACRSRRFTGCVVAVVLFAKGRAFRCSRLATWTCAVGPIGLFPRPACNLSMANCGAARPTCHGDGIPTGGPLPRHPSQLYEARAGGIVLLIVLGLLVRGGALRRPGLIIARSRFGMR